MTFYRFEDYGVSHGTEEFGFFSTRTLALREFAVVKETPKGAWIAGPFGLTKRFVRLDARKRYACPTVEEARESFMARKKRQIKILKTQLVNAEESLQLAEEWRAEARDLRVGEASGRPAASEAL
jgi:hypothetical protein